MAKLAAFVRVTDGRGEYHVFGPDDEVPAWAVSLITNPAAWAGGTVPDPELSASRLAEPVKPPAKRAAPRRKAAASDAVHDG